MLSATKLRDKLTGVALGTGRRKTAVARVRVKPGNGKVTVNDRELLDYFPSEKDRFQLVDVLNQTGKSTSVDVNIQVHGSGPASQAGACKLGIARALKVHDPELEPILREKSLLTRDSRMKERKHYGLRGARRGTQFSKR